MNFPFLSFFFFELTQKGQWKSDLFRPLWQTEMKKTKKIRRNIFVFKWMYYGWGSTILKEWKCIQLCLFGLFFGKFWLITRETKEGTPLYVSAAGRRLQWTNKYRVRRHTDVYHEPAVEFLLEYGAVCAIGLQFCSRRRACQSKSRPKGMPPSLVSQVVALPRLGRITGQTFKSLYKGIMMSKLASYQPVGTRRKKENKWKRNGEYRASESEWERENKRRERGGNIMCCNTFCMRVFCISVEGLFIR